MFYLDLSYALVSKVHPKVTASSLYAVLAYGRFHGNTVLSDSGETCI